MLLRFFDQYTETVFPVLGKTQYLVDEALKIKATGVEKAFEKEFAEMENNIQEIRDIIRNANVSSNDIKDIEMNLKQLRSAVIAYYPTLEQRGMGIDKIYCIIMSTISERTSGDGEGVINIRVFFS